MEEQHAQRRRPRGARRGPGRGRRNGHCRVGSQRRLRPLTARRRSRPRSLQRPPWSLSRTCYDAATSGMASGPRTAQTFPVGEATRRYHLPARTRVRSTPAPPSTCCHALHRPHQPPFRGRPGDHRGRRPRGPGGVRGGVGVPCRRDAQRRHELPPARPAPGRRSRLHPGLRLGDQPREGARPRSSRPSSRCSWPASTWPACRRCTARRSRSPPSAPSRSSWWASSAGRWPAPPPGSWAPGWLPPTRCWCSRMRRCRPRASTGSWSASSCSSRCAGGVAGTPGAGWSSVPWWAWPPSPGRRRCSCFPWWCSGPPAPGGPCSSPPSRPWWSSVHG